MIVWDDRNKSDEELEVIKVFSRYENYWFVLLDNGVIGLINIDNGTFISDQRDFYVLKDKDIIKKWKLE